MLTIFDGLRDITLSSILLRLLLAFVCGGAVGLERSYKNRPAGFRTHILVCIAAATASMTGIYLYLNLHLPTDVSRLGASIVSGLGFIGGGTIMVTRKNTVRGLTTASGLWATGIIGLAVGACYFEGAILATVCVLLTETLFYKLSRNITPIEVLRVHVLYHEKAALDRIMRYCKDRRVEIRNLQITGTSGENASAYDAIITLRPRLPIDKDELLDTMELFDGIVAVKYLEN